MTVYLLIFLIVIVAPIGTIIHELGHSIVALLAGADAVDLHVGIGKPIKKYELKRFTVHLNVIVVIGGLTRSKRTRTYSPNEKIWIALGGPLGNAILVILLIILFYPTHNPYVQLFTLFQAWMMFINIIPFRWKQKQSDGYTIIKMIAEKVTKDSANK